MQEAMYRRIYLDLLNDILEKKYTESDRLPTEHELSIRYGVSRITSKKALDMLAAEKRVVRIAGKGTFVNSSVLKGTTDKPHMVGVVMSDHSSIFGSSFIRGIQSICKEQNTLVIPAMSYQTQDEEAAEISRLIKQGVTGIILMPLHSATYNPIILSNLLTGFPMVMADRYLPGLSVPYVGTNNVESAKDITQYLFSLGHENIAFISSMTTTTTLKERIEGYVFAYARSNYSFNRSYTLTDLNSTMPGFYDVKHLEQDVMRICNFFNAHPELTAAIAADYPVARVLHMALLKMGKRVPQDVSIICYDSADDLIDKLSGLPIFTHIRQQEYEMGIKAAELLFDIMNGKVLNNTEYHLTYNLVEGNTVADISSL